MALFTIDAGTEEWFMCILVSSRRSLVAAPEWPEMGLIVEHASEAHHANFRANDAHDDGFLQLQT